MTRKKVITAIEELGGAIEIEEDHRRIDCNADAPAGKVWAATGTHTLVFWTYKGKGASKAMWVDALKEVKMGVEDCPETDCDVCEESQ